MEQTLRTTTELIGGCRRAYSVQIASHFRLRLWANVRTLVAMDAVERLISAIEALPHDLTNGEVVALFGAYDRLAARLTAAMDRIDPTADGAITLPQWLRSCARRSGAEAAAVVKRSTRLRSCPVAAAAWSDGVLATGQIDAVVAHVADRTAPIFTDHEPDLVPHLVGLSVRHTEVAMRRWAAYADTLVEAPPPNAEQRTIQLSAGVDGWGELSGRLDPAGRRVVDAALHAATVVDRPGEPARTPGQRRADALVAVARHFLDHAATASTSRGSRPDVTVVVTIDDLGRGSGCDIDGLPLDVATIESLLCDAGVHRVVTDGRSVALDVGRTTRTVSHHLFTALAVRDGGCRFPGCDIPVSRCEAHHVVPWQHGGSTDQSNLVLLCWRHHHDFAHHPQWHLKLLPDATVEVTKPDGTTMSGRPPPIGVPTVLIA
jgi:hypothetical protein